MHGFIRARTDNNLLEIFQEFAERIHFLHLGSTKRDYKGTFYEANHLEGDFDMFEVVRAILIKNKKKKVIDQLENSNETDHGHQMLDDLNKKQILIFC